MATDRYTAFWISYSSIKDFQHCPREYFLKNVYKDPKTNHKIKLVNPFLSLGQAVHETLDSLSILTVKDRFKDSLLPKFEKSWEKISGKKGGFSNKDAEEVYKNRGERMIRRLIQNPGPLSNLAVKLRGDLPSFWLSEENNIILCGKIDWLEYFPTTDSVHIIEFKTSKNKETDGSLQLPIYYLLAKNCQKRPVSKLSYWYLDLSNEPEEKPIPEPKKSQAEILKIAKQIKLQKQLQRLVCRMNGCAGCKPYEAVLRGEAELVGSTDRDNLYLYGGPTEEEEEDSIIL